MIGFDALILGATNALNLSKETIRNEKTEQDIQNVSSISKEVKLDRKKSAY